VKEREKKKEKKETDVTDTYRKETDRQTDPFILKYV